MLVARLKNLTADTHGRWRRGASEDGAALVEMAISCAILVVMIFGIIQFCLMAYCLNFAAEAAREGSRYASVRGEYSCQGASSFPDCDLGPKSSGNAVETYIQSLGYPFSTAMTSKTTWWSPTGTKDVAWTIPCTEVVDKNAGSPLGGSTGNQCNYPGHAVQVTVTYPFPIQIPFVPASTLTVTSTSKMVINN